MAEAKRKPGRPPGSKNKNSSGKASANASGSSKGAQSKAQARARAIQAERKADRRVIDEIWAIIAIAVGIFLIVATFTAGAGQFGEMIGNAMKGVLGFIAYVLPFYIILYGVLLFAKKTVHISLKSGILILVILLMLTTINSIRFIEPEKIELSLAAMKGFYTTGVTLKSGGFIGMILASLLTKWFGTAGCWIFSVVVLIISSLLLINTPVSRFASRIGDKLEERRLIKEHEHLDDETIIEEGVQMSMNDTSKESRIIGPEKAEKRNPFMSSHKREIKVINSSVLEEKEDEAETAEPEVKMGLGDMDATEPVITEENPIPQRSYVPLSQMEEEPFEKKNSVLKYMYDDSLFGKTPSNSLGLEERSDYGEGYGLDGTGKRQSIVSQAEIDEIDEMEQITIETASQVTSQSISQSSNRFINKTGETIVPGTPAGQMPQKLSNKEAREAMLTVEELSGNQNTIRIYRKPPIDLLTKSAGGAKANHRSLQAKALKLENTLKNFHVDARVVQVTQGPTVTRYEIQPAVGVKVSSIVRLSDDIALNLEAKSIRIEAPIPGKAAVGIEVENDAVTMVKLRDIIDSKEFKDAKSKITFAVGKDISIGSSIYFCSVSKR